MSSSSPVHGVAGAVAPGGIVGVHLPLEQWSIKEQLWLACAVVRNGDQNWMSVSRALKPLTAAGGRPADWFSHKACAAQYGALLENVRTPRRKKRPQDPDSRSHSPQEVGSSPQDTIMKRLVQERLDELQKIMTETEQSYAKLKDDVKELKSSGVTESRIRAMYAAHENDRRNRDKEAAKKAQWIKERDDRRALLERTWRRPDAEPPHPSPLLTSLLRSPTSLGHPSATESSTPGATVSTERTSSTIESNGSEDAKSLSAISAEQKIEEIKSVLLEVEEKYIGGTISSDANIMNAIRPLGPPVDGQLPISKDQDAGKHVERVDIDDIEIKEEDVYAFSDIDLDIPPVSSMHKPSGRNSDKMFFNKKDSGGSGVEDAAALVSAPDTAEVLNSLLSPVHPECSNVDILGVSNDENIADKSENTTTVAPNAEASDSQEKSDKPEIVAPTEEPKENKTEESVEVSETIEATKDCVEKPETPANSETPKPDSDANNPEEGSIKTESDIKIELEEPSEEQMVKTDQTPAPKKPEDSQQQTGGAESQTESNIETDDDTPIEVIKEDKPGKTKRDYSRKKVDKDGRNTPAEIDETVIKSECSDEIGSDNSQGPTERKILNRRFRSEGSRSESPATPMDSLPGSPAPSTPPLSSLPASTSALEHEKFKTWKKSVISIYLRLTSLKFASLFTRPITDEQAPKYSLCVKRPMDLSTIKRNIESGVIKRTVEFERDVLLMLTNALMYNRTDHSVHNMAKETMKETVKELSYLTYIPESEAIMTTPIQRARARPVPKPVGTPKRKRGGGGSANEGSATKKKKADEQ